MDFKIGERRDEVKDVRKTPIKKTNEDAVAEDEDEDEVVTFLNNIFELHSMIGDVNDIEHGMECSEKVYVDVVEEDKTRGKERQDEQAS